MEAGSGPERAEGEDGSSFAPGARPVQPQETADTVHLSCTRPRARTLPTLPPFPP